MKTIIRRHRQTGFTMIEMMVSLGIGIVVALAATQLFITNQMSFNLQKGLGDVSENGRFAIEYISKQMRAGNFKPANPLVPVWPTVLVDTSDAPATLGLPAGVFSADNKAALAAPATGAQGGIGPSDQLLIQYYTPVSTRDCEGNAVPANNYVLSRYFLRADTTAGTGSALVCEGGYHDGSSGAVLTNFATTDTGGAVMLAAVDSFQVLLGTANDTTGIPERFMTVSTYAALSPRPQISAVRLGLLVSSIERAGTMIGAAQGVTVLDPAVASTSIPVDNRVRRLFAGTVSLRNVLN